MGDAVLNAYPLFFIFAGLVASTFLYRRALALMQPDAKAALADSSSSTNWLNIIVIGLFVVLVIWRPLAAWIFLGCAYLGLAARSVIRLRRLNLPTRAARLVLLGNCAAVAGITLCATIFALRALPTP
jgi:hypothetical protein